MKNNYCQNCGAADGAHAAWCNENARVHEYMAALSNTPAETNIDATLNERGSRYGKFVDHARITQELKRIIFENVRQDLADDQSEALEMIAHKIGRIVNGDPNYADSWVDIAGYAKLVADRLQGVER